jgi:preprotein translocase subunit SecA
MIKIFKKDPLKDFYPILQQVNEFEKELEKKSDEEIKEEYLKIKEKVKNGEDKEKYLSRVFALVREASKRTLGQRHYDVQILGGIALSKGKIAQMLTGEGKTLTATLAAAFHALEGKGVHIVTVNDYLAKRDTVWMGQIYNFLGLSVGCIVENESYLYDPSFINENLEKKRDELSSFLVFYEYLRPATRRESYSADILYGTNHEFCFDFLRDHLSFDKFNVVQVNFDLDSRSFYFAIIDEIDSILIDEARTPLIISSYSSLPSEFYIKFDKIAKNLEKDKDFEIDEKRKTVSLNESGIEKIVKFLGYNPYQVNDLTAINHIIEALRANYLFFKDKDYIVKNNQVFIVDPFTGRILQNRRWSGGLHQAIEAKEGVPINPENKTIASITFQNFFKKYKILAGMTGTAIQSAEEFEKIYGLEVVEIPPNKPCIRKDLPDLIFATKEAKWKAVVKKIKELYEKGQPVLVGTISIENNEYLSSLLKKEGIPHQVLNAKNHEQEGKIIAQAGKFKTVTIATNMAGRGVDIVLGGNPPDPEDREKVIKAGGLFVLGTERHEARRIDDQLRGRSGRQGDPGESQFFVSLEDDLIRIFGGEKVKEIMKKLNFPEDQPIENKMVTKIIEEAQKKVEGFNFDIRKSLLDYDDVISRQRESIYKLREDILFEKIDPIDFLKKAFSEFYEENKDDKNILGFVFEIKENLENVNLESIFESKIEKIKEFFEEEDKNFKDALRVAILKYLDELWAEHLNYLEGLRETIYLRSYGQKDPLVEFKKEATLAFSSFKQFLNFNLLYFIMRVKTEKTYPKVGRNDPCPCGSGLKYKKCHGR